MVTVSHFNGDEKVVTKGAFESIFKPLGYKITDEKEKVEREKLDSHNKELDDVKDNDDSKSDDRSRRK